MVLAVAHTRPLRSTSYAHRRTAVSAGQPQNCPEGEPLSTPQAVGMLRPNWFDDELNETIAETTAEETLAIIAKSPKLIRTLKEAITEFETQPRIMGLSRTQMIRRTIADTIMQEAC